MSVGWAEGRNPNPHFNTEWYFRTYPDVEKAGFNPLVHYCSYGQREGRLPNPDFGSEPNPRPFGKDAALAHQGRQQLPAASLFGATSTFHERIYHAQRACRNPEAVAIVCWDGAHNPIGRAKVLYDAVPGDRPVVLFSYLFTEFGGKLWTPLEKETLNYIGIPWKDRHQYHTLFDSLQVKFNTVWVCKPRLPSFILASALSHRDTKLILDIDDNEEHFSRSPAATTKVYGRSGISASNIILKRIKARTVASASLQRDFGGIIVRHARQIGEPAATARLKPEEKVGFLGTVRPHKNIIDVALAVRHHALMTGKNIKLHVYGDVLPVELRDRLTEAGAVVHGLVPFSQAQEIIRECAVMITGFPSNSHADADITKYQITAKIGDSLAVGRPVLVPDTPGVRDLEGTDGLYLFNKENFPDQLVKALNHKSQPALPYEFTIEAATKGFLNAEAEAFRAERACDIFSAMRSLPYRECTQDKRERVVLVWKQHDAGLYGRRVDQIARSYKRFRPDADVIVLEFLHKSALENYERNSSDWTSDAEAITELALRKINGGYTCSDGVKYQAILHESDDGLPKAFMKFVAENHIVPENTKFIIFPIVRPILKILDILSNYPLVVDFVDNQFSWASAGETQVFREQYRRLAASARHIVFNSEQNLKHFVREGIVQTDANVTVIPNWYTAPKSIHRQTYKKSAERSIIYSGNMNDRIDWVLMNAVAELGYTLHLAGNAYRSPPEFHQLVDRPNVLYHGPLKEDAAYAIIASCHVAIMPHTRDNFSDFMNPLKIHMYASTGIPVVSTEVNGLARAPNVVSSGTQEGFIDLVNHMVGSASSRTILSNRKQSSRAKLYARVIHSCLPKGSQ